jgi:hypothetical protein
MVAFGLFLLLAVGIIAGFALADGSDPTVLNLLGFEVDTTERWQFATGAFCALGAVIALRVIVIGWRRARRRRHELRELRETVGQTEDSQRHQRESSSRHDRDEDERDHFESAPHD